jgi:uncharacterized SAM-binding protein YcdF (DUF218 family)
MLYAIKVIYTWLLPPGGIVLLLLAASIYFLRRNRQHSIVVGVITLLLYLSSVPWLSDRLVRSLEQQYVPPSTLQGDIIVVLGGGVTPDTTGVSGIGQPSTETASRMITAVELYQATGLPILFSGGQVFTGSGNEADIGIRILHAMGVPKEKLVAEGDSRNTNENAENVKAVLEQGNYTRPILVTQAFHMPRAVRTFARLGVEVIPYPTGYYAERTSGGLSIKRLTPSYDALYHTGLSLKEYLGMLALRF